MIKNTIDIIGLFFPFFCGAEALSPGPHERAQCCCQVLSLARCSFLVVSLEFLQLLKLHSTVLFLWVSTSLVLQHLDRNTNIGYGGEEEWILQRAQAGLETYTRCLISLCSSPCKGACLTVFFITQEATPIKQLPLFFVYSKYCSTFHRYPVITSRLMLSILWSLLWLFVLLLMLFCSWDSLAL